MLAGTETEVFVSGLFSDDELRNGRAEEPWKKSETDKMLDLYLAGGHPKEIAYTLQRNPKAVKRRLEQFTYNERDRAVLYEPFKRVSRRGQRFTENEKLMIQEHNERKVAPEHTAKVLQRKVDEINPDGTRKAIIKAGTTFAPTMDIVLALRYIYYIYDEMPSPVSDETYDRMVVEEIEFGGGEKILLQYAKGGIRSVPSRIKTLALYLCELLKDSKKTELFV